MKHTLCTQKVNKQKFIWAVILKMLLIHFLIHFYKIFNVYKKDQRKEELNLVLIVLKY